MLAGAFEHQVFEKVRQTGLARRLVGRADLVPDHLRDDWRAVVRYHQDLEAVAQCERGGWIRRHRGLCASAGRGERGSGEQYGKDRCREAGWEKNELASKGAQKSCRREALGG